MMVTTSSDRIRMGRYLWRRRGEERACCDVVVVVVVVSFSISMMNGGRGKEEGIERKKGEEGEGGFV